MRKYYEDLRPIRPPNTNQMDGQQHGRGWRMTRMVKGAKR